MKENIEMFLYSIRLSIASIWMSIPFVQNYYNKKINKSIINNCVEPRKEFIDAGYQIEKEEKIRRFLINECLENVLNN